MDQLNSHLEQYHLGTLVGLEHAPTFHIDRDGKFTSTKNPGHTSYSGPISGGASDVYIHPSAFSSTFKLFLVTGHELIHASDNSLGIPGQLSKAYPNYSLTDMLEFRAYKWQAHQERLYGTTIGGIVKYQNLKSKVPAVFLNK